MITLPKYVLPYPIYLCTNPNTYFSKQNTTLHVTFVLNAINTPQFIVWQSASLVRDTQTWSSRSSWVNVYRCIVCFNRSSAIRNRWCWLAGFAMNRCPIPTNSIVLITRLLARAAISSLVLLGCNVTNWWYSLQQWWHGDRFYICALIWTNGASSIAS